MWILAMAMMVGAGANAQEFKQRHEPLKPEQRAELQSKKMALALDLNDRQQKDVQKLLAENAKHRAEFRRLHMAERHAGKKLTADEKFAVRSKVLDERIAMKREMKKILTPEQFNKMEEMKAEKHAKAQHQKLSKKEKKDNFRNRR